MEAAYNQVAQSIAAFERTSLFAQFSSQYDYYLYTCINGGGGLHECAKGTGTVAATIGPTIFTGDEWNGLQLFMNENDNDGILEEGEGAMCAACHVADWTNTADYPLTVVVPTWAPAGMVPPVFTDFSFDNLGVPKNPENPFYYLPRKFNPDGVNFVDYGLGAFLKNAGYDSTVYDIEMGKVKVMTLRNIGVTGPYMHNGYFKSLAGVVNPYNTRAVKSICAGDFTEAQALANNCWPLPEVSVNVNDTELGNLGLTPQDEQDIVKFMQTLTDGYTP